MLATLRRRLPSTPTPNGKNPIRQMIGRTVAGIRTAKSRLYLTRKTVDQTIPDYEFWDKLRHGKAKGFELSGLMVRPASEIVTSWVIGDDFTSRLSNEDEYTTEAVNRFIRRVRPELVQLITDSYVLGDQYIVVNADGSISIPSPDTVETIDNPLDYRQPLGYIIHSRLDKLSIDDEYRADRRIIRVKNNSSELLETPIGPVAAGQSTEIEFDNLIGAIPVIHFANERSANETHGRSMFDSLYALLSWYDDLLVKGLSGAERLSNPILKFFKLTDAAATKAANAEPVGEMYLDEDEIIRQREEVDVEADDAVLFIDGEGDADFIGPPNGFTNDIRNMLKALYLLFSEHLSIPDVVMGFELGQARASASEQLRTFFASIRRRRLMLEGKGGDELLGFEPADGLLEVIDIWMRFRALVDSAMKLSPVSIMWPELSEREETTKQAWAFGAYDRGLIQGQTVVEASNLVEDAASEVEAATLEQDARRDQFDAALDEAIANRNALTENEEQVNLSAESVPELA